MIRLKGTFMGQQTDLTISYEHSIAELDAIKLEAKDAPVVVGVLMDTMVPIIETVAEKFPAIAEALFKLAEDKLPWYIKWQKEMAKRGNALAKKFWKN